MTKKQAQEYATTKEGTQVRCETCLYLATHEKCDKPDCLHTPEDYRTSRTNGCMPPPRFLNWKESNPVEQMSRLHAMQVSGKRSIVIGGSGEAEVNAKQTPAECSKQLHYVAEQCGYFAGNLKQNPDGSAEIIISTEGTYKIIWGADGKLSKIMHQVYKTVYSENPNDLGHSVLVREVVAWDSAVCY